MELLPYLAVMEPLILRVLRVAIWGGMGPQREREL